MNNYVSDKCECTPVACQDTPDTLNGLLIEVHKNQIDTMEIMDSIYNFLYADVANQEKQEDPKCFKEELERCAKRSAQIKYAMNELRNRIG